MIDEKRYIKYMIDNNINQEEFLLLYCLYKCSNGTDTQLLELMKQYTTTFGFVKANGKKAMVSNETKQKLIRDGFLQKIDEKDTFKSYQLTVKFTKSFVDQYEAINELYQAYPGFGKIKGVSIPLKGGNIHENAKEYWLAIRATATLHHQIVEATNWARLNKPELLSCNISNYIHGRMWTDIVTLFNEQIVKGRPQGTSSIIAKDF